MDKSITKPTHKHNISQESTWRASNFSSPQKVLSPGRFKSCLEVMTAKEKEDHIAWIMEQLKNKRFFNSKVIHQITLIKSDLDAYKQEVLMVKDIISESKLEEVQELRE